MVAKRTQHVAPNNVTPNNVAMCDVAGELAIWISFQAFFGLLGCGYSLWLAVVIILVLVLRRSLHEGILVLPLLNFD